MILVSKVYSSCLLKRILNLRFFITANHNTVNLYYCHRQFIDKLNKTAVINIIPIDIGTYANITIINVSSIQKDFSHSFEVT